jgi:ABC-type uncharacterized transport system substrate-binding protein
MMPKRLELLTELVPQPGVIVLLVNPNDERLIGDVQEAARAKGLLLHILRASSESEIDAAFATLIQLHAGALLISADPFFNSRREQLVALASRHAIPAIYAFREWATAGGLISYGPPHIACRDTEEQRATARLLLQRFLGALTKERQLKFAHGAFHTSNRRSLGCRGS